LRKPKNNTPTVVIVGLGRFGKQHLETWRLLAKEGLVEVAGAVASGQQNIDALRSQYDIPIFAGLESVPWDKVTAVDVVTPSLTHHAIASRCLPHAHVLLEKPLGMSRRETRAMVRQAGSSGNILMVNHLYRFHPTLEGLRRAVKKEPSHPILIVGSFLNPLEAGVEQYSANHEFLHYFDIVDYLFGQSPEIVSVESFSHVNEVSLRYSSGMNVVLELGWRGDQRVRQLELHYSQKKLHADFQGNILTISDPAGRVRTLEDRGCRPLEAALRSFLAAIRGRKVSYPDVHIGARIVDVALRAMPGPRKSLPRAAIIGGGIFGSSCALEMARYCDVVLAERHSELLTEASANNQLRHHSGFHYPRSLETLQEILSCRAEFDSVYGPAVVRNVGSYYCTSARAKEITGERYLGFCRENRLPFSVQAPPAGLVEPSRISLSLSTDEQVLDITRLREMIRTRLQNTERLEIRMKTEVVSGEFGSRGEKRLRFRTGNRTKIESFDYLINATYANSNIISGWFGFPVRRLRFDLCEMLLLEIPMPNLSITILDAPFVSLMSTGQNNQFLLYQVHDAVMKSLVTEDGLPPYWSQIQSNRLNVMRHATEYLPILRDARYLGSRYGNRVVTAFNEDYDGRPTVITRHGFGCWSVLGGKIATCVSNAREIALQIFPEAAVGESTPAAKNAS
jgi:predicted dehydrogenase/glycine/D-amino acid oxidase-like deaminating enzyme